MTGWAVAAVLALFVSCGPSPTPLVGFVVALVVVGCGVMIHLIGKGLR